jgi:hypothetical protein
LLIKILYSTCIILNTIALNGRRLVRFTGTGYSQHPRKRDRGVLGVLSITMDTFKIFDLDAIRDCMTVTCNLLMLLNARHQCKCIQPEISPYNLFPLRSALPPLQRGP